MIMRSCGAALAGIAFVAGLVMSPLDSPAMAQTSGASNAAAPGNRQNMPGMQMKMHEQMMAQMKADDAKLDALVKELTAAKGDARLDALVATVNEMARQLKAERAHMGMMHEMMAGEHGGTQAAPAPDHAHGK